jgi:ubiquinone/menaquinone biosynthesis C-methylase UbiE
MNRDKQIEQKRYDARARVQLSSGADTLEPLGLGSGAIRQSHRTPYIVYEAIVRDVVSARHRVLELAAGCGMHTQVLVSTGAHVVATDISQDSLKLLERNVQAQRGRLMLKVADMEELPFPDCSFDVVTCAGGLSYGEPGLVNSEINRVLRPGGALICVDSLDNNPIYRLNRWFQYALGTRTKSTLLRMPNLLRINELSYGYSFVKVRYFGAFSFAAPIIAKLSDEKRAQEIVDRLDRLVNTERSAFKFVLLAKDKT